MSIEKLDFTRIIKDKTPFTTFLNIVIQNIKNPISLAIWVFLESLPHDWQVNKKQLMNHFDLGREKLDKHLSYLKSIGLVEMISIRNPDGTIASWAIHIKSYSSYFDQFIHNTENPYCGSSTILKIQGVDNPVNGKSVPTKEIEKKQKENTTTTNCEIDGDDMDFYSEPVVVVNSAIASENPKHQPSSTIEKLTSFYNRNPIVKDNILCLEDFLSAAQYSLKEADKNGYSAEQRLRAIEKFVAAGKFDEPHGWAKIKKEDAHDSEWFRQIKEKEEYKQKIAAETAEQKIARESTAKSFKNQIMGMLSANMR